MQPEDYFIDLATWRAILVQLEDRKDIDALRAAENDLKMLAEGKRPAGWQSWEAFEAELDDLEY